MEDRSDTLTCEAEAILNRRTGVSLLVCQWDTDVPPPTPPPTPPPLPSVKIMVAGDSISHGMENDWTWRWRLFAWSM